MKFAALLIAAAGVAFATQALPTHSDVAPPKDDGCGCRLPASGPTQAGWVAAGLALLLVARRRR